MTTELSIIGHIAEQLEYPEGFLLGSIYGLTRDYSRKGEEGMTWKPITIQHYHSGLSLGIYVKNQKLPNAYSKIVR